MKNRLLFGKNSATLLISLESDPKSHGVRWQTFLNQKAPVANPHKN